MRSEERCVCCGAVIPEGRMICLDCENGETTVEDRKEKEDSCFHFGRFVI